MAIKTYHICEFGTICQQGDLFNKDGSSSSENVVCLEEKKFRSFRGFILKNQNPDILNTPTFSLFSKNGRERIKVGQHVGVIETPSGIRLEILPKVYLKDTDESVIKTKKIFIKMLRCLKDSPFKNLSSAHLDAQPDFPILEIFISTFVTECESLLNKSIRSDYVLVEENLNFVRGKLLVHQNIKYNFINKMKFYCEFCEFIIITPQNRVLKTTLFKLLGKTRNRKNFTSLNRLISNFDSVDASSNILKDLINSKNICNNNNLYFSYKNILVWCEVFLTNKSSVNFSGDASNTAVVFAKWRLFQDYVTSVFRKHAKGFIVKTIDPSCFLINKHIDSSYSQIKPDLVFDMDGGLYFTDFKGQSTLPHGGVYYVSPDFSTTSVVLPNMAGANGVALSPDGKVLWATEFSASRLHRVELNNATTIAHFGATVPYHFVGRAPDSMRTDADGNVYVAMYHQGRILVFSPYGIPIGQILLPGREKNQFLKSTSLAFFPGSSDLVIVSRDEVGGGGSVIFKAKGFAKGVNLFSHQT